ncbi:MAG: DUF262 domain-containing protein [Clostridia bacterium]|nr:DUF262 domain-containing protein [Clostridia bacterium]
MSDGIKISVDGREIRIKDCDVNTVKTIKDIFNTECSRTSYIGTKSIADIEKNKYLFFVGSYQRGYRWRKDEVEALLDDLYNFWDKYYSNSRDKNIRKRYCLQPLMLKLKTDTKTDVNDDTKTGTENNEGADSKKSGYKNVLYKIIQNKDSEESKNICTSENISSDEVGDVYELIDGQQRLTTLYIILTYCQMILDNNTSKGPGYNIVYENIKNSDQGFIESAYSTVKRWFENKSELHILRGAKRQKAVGYNKDKLSDFIDVVKSQVCFVWYVAAVDEDCKKLFTKINSGIIPLTNAELFKAMLLNKADTDSYGESIAFEWDQIEQSMRNNSFWGFICNDASYDDKMRIDYILQIYALKLKAEHHLDKYKEYKDRFSFLTVYDYLQNNIGKVSVEDIWTGIVQVYNKLYSWYSDIELYNNIGFIVAANSYLHKKNSANTVKDLYAKYSSKTNDEVRNDIRAEVRKVFDDLFANDKNKESIEKLVYSFVHETDDAKLREQAESLVAVFNYDESEKGDNRKIYLLLLYLNIYTCIRSVKDKPERNSVSNNTGRFDFMSYYSAFIKDDAGNDDAGDDFEEEDVNDDVNGDESGENEESDVANDEKESNRLKGWDIEHVNPRDQPDGVELKEFIKSFKSPDQEKEKRDNLDCIVDFINTYNVRHFKKEDSAKYCDLPHKEEWYDDLDKAWTSIREDVEGEYTHGGDGDSINGICNLVLLDSSTNRSYRNMLFNMKRNKIISRNNDAVFILPVTLNVFQKYYNKNPEHFIYWEGKDREGYREEFVSMLYYIYRGKMA